MVGDQNPYQPPLSLGDRDNHLYEISRCPSTTWKGTQGLIDEIAQRAKSGWRLVTEFNGGANDRFLIWTRTDRESTATSDGDFQILPLPRFLECLRLRSFGPWPRPIAAKMSELEPGWAFASFCSSVGYVLRKSHDFDGRSDDRRKYTVLKLAPVWWRTLFGTSWIGLLSDQLTSAAPHGSEVVSYIGDNTFLLQLDSGHREEVTVQPRHRAYQLSMWPNWKTILVTTTPNITPWLDDQAAHGWRLVSHYEGAIFLFATDFT